MDRYTRHRGGSIIWTNKSVASEIINSDFFGTNKNKLWIKISGVWKVCNTFINVYGVWKSVKLYLKRNGQYN